MKLTRWKKAGQAAGCALALWLAPQWNQPWAHEAEPIEFNPAGIPYSWAVELSAGEHAEIPPGHVGAWSWDEDGFPATARGWTHTSQFIKLELTGRALLSLKAGSAANVPWPSPEEPNRLAGTNLFPSFTLYRGWDTDAGVHLDTNGVTIDQDHTFNNRGNIEWAEDAVYLDHLENHAEHAATRTWLLPAGRYTINVGGNSPATVAEGRQGIAVELSASAPVQEISGGSVAVVEFDPVGIPYGLSVALDDEARVETPPDHVGAWSWDEDGFPATARGWTHTSKFIKLNLLKPAELSLTLASRANVPWPSPEDANRLAGTNLFPSFTLYRGWDTDAGVQLDTNGVTIDQNHTFNNRGDIEWAEDAAYMDHLENSSEHAVARTWRLPAGRYTINLGGNSPATVAEGRQGYLAVLETRPAVMLQASRTAPGVSLGWPERHGEFKLYEAPTLNGPWTQAPGDSLLEHGWKAQDRGSDGAMRFFRLQK